MLIFYSRVWCAFGAITFGALLTTVATAAEPVGQIPDEYETTNGYGVGMNNAGYAANDPHAAIRANPALLPAAKEYSMSAGYHWPVSGREYFQAGVVDGKTSSIAAGVSYTGFMDEYLDPTTERTAPKFDSPIVRRGVVGVGQAFASASAGIGATYVEAHPVNGSEAQLRGDERVKGVGLNMGMAMPLTPELRIGASVENATNKKIADYAPKTYRAGAAYSFASTVSGYFDFRQRDRVSGFETPEVDLLSDEQPKELEPERMALISMAAKIQDFLRIMGSYGQAIGDDRRALAGGISLLNNNFSLSYTAARPYMQKNAAAHQAISLSMQVAM